MTLTKNDLVEQIVDRLYYKKREALEHVESVLAIMKETLETGDNLKISGFGNFEVKQKSDRRGRNPHTGESLIINARRVITFKPSNLLRDAINK